MLREQHRKRRSAVLRFSLHSGNSLLKPKATVLPDTHALSLDLLLSLPGQFGRAEPGALDDGHLVVARCCRENALLADDPADSGLGPASLSNSPAPVLCKGGLQPDPQPASGLRGEAGGLIPHSYPSVVAAVVPLFGEEDRLGL